jgi:hypothetical protein
VSASTNRRAAFARQNEQPLVCTPVAVIRPAFAIAGRDDHSRHLCALVRKRYREALAESKMFNRHEHSLKSESAFRQQSAVPLIRAKTPQIIP